MQISRIIDTGHLESGLVEQAVGGGPNISPHFRSSPGQRDKGKIHMELSLVFGIKRAKRVLTIEFILTIAEMVD